MNCPNCSSNYVINDGFVKRRIGNVQRYKCNSCGKFFTEKKLLNKQYNPGVILRSLILYNQGLTLAEAAKEVNKRFHVNIYPQLVSNWLKEYKKICTYSRIRPKEKVNFDEIVFLKNFEHKQIYQFMYHKLKIEKHLSDYFRNLRWFLENVNNKCPSDLFNKDNARGSQIKLKIVPEIRKTRNYACLLSDLALKANKDNKKRHKEIQEFMLFNDSSTIAIEIPVWLYPAEFDGLKVFNGIEKPITGHVDFLQQRFGLIHILDYKPEAEKENPVSQLFFYAFALSKRTGIWLRNFRCAWFNEKAYFEFNPNEIILKNEDLNGEQKKEYVLDRGKQLFHEQRMFDEWKKDSGGKKND